MGKELRDRKNPLSFAVWSLVNRLSVSQHFQALEFQGRQHLPSDEPFIMVANHVSRWDGLLLHELIGRPANWLVSPNELKGFQGVVLKSMGAFPADYRRDPVGYVLRQTARGEGVVVFPEGDIKRDGVTHRFKSGAARMALHCALNGVPLRVLPAAIGYQRGRGEIARVVVGEPVDLAPYVQEFAAGSTMSIRELTVRLHREVCHLRTSLGALADRRELFLETPMRQWVPRLIQGNRGEEGDDVRGRQANEADTRLVGAG